MNNQTQSTVSSTGQVPVTQPSMLNSLLPICLVMLVFYFLMIRPQQKRENQKKSMLSALKKGDKIVTLGGIIGTVHKVTNQSEISLEISEGVRIRILKTSIGDVLDKNSPLNKEESVDIQKVDKNKK
ncbi:MAG: preprotein translocase subunit YajC [Alphaproteobacteria bacterium]|nr:preprotein translocase subunit YajC [Alphaproteobacteria bacterium]